jgi:hypothetical protein
VDTFYRGAAARAYAKGCCVHRLRVYRYDANHANGSSGAKGAFDGNDAASREIARRGDEGMWIVANTGTEAALHGFGVFVRK